MAGPLLVTAYDRFGKLDMNPTSEGLVTAHARGMLPAGVEIGILPVSWRRAVPAFRELIERYQPSRVVSLGVGGIVSPTFRWELVGHNLKDINIRDVDGELGEIHPIIGLGGQPSAVTGLIDPDGIPEVRTSRVGFEAVQAALAAIGFGLEDTIVHDYPGDYLCNYLIYLGAQILRAQNIPFSFLHGPINQEIPEELQRYFAKKVGQESAPWPEVIASRRIPNLEQYTVAVATIVHALVGQNSVLSISDSTPV